MRDDEVNLDHERARRLGFDEAILCGFKNTPQVSAILDRAAARNATLLLTRLEADQVAELSAAHREQLEYDPVSRTGFFGAVEAPAGPTRVAVVTAGTSDVPVAREAVRTLTYYGKPVLEIFDVGVAGIHRLNSRLEDIRQLPVVIAVAGMDAALPSVIGGLVPGLVIGVPTSVGYGVATGGKVALGAILASCAPGILVVNIDNGFGAACAAMRALNALPKATAPD